MVHEHPGVYSSYDASSVIGGKKTARILGAAAVSTTGTANEVVTLTSYAEGVSAFGEDAEGTVGMAALLAALYRNGAAVVKAVKVSAATPTGYEAAFAALEQEAVDVIVCDSTSVDVQLKLRASVEKVSGAQRERIGVVSGGASETAAKLVDDVIPALRASLRARFVRSKNTAQVRAAIRSQVMVELENKRAQEIIDSFGEVSVKASEDDPTVCLVEFSFAVAHGLNRIYLSAHITV